MNDRNGHDMGCVHFFCFYVQLSQYSDFIFPYYVIEYNKWKIWKKIEKEDKEDFIWMQD